MAGSESFLDVLHFWSNVSQLALSNDDGTVDEALKKDAAKRLRKMKATCKLAFVLMLNAAQNLTQRELTDNEVSLDVCVSVLAIDLNLLIS